ncbi:MAG: tetrahydrofolate dehydrogenase/cyclohydrolase catalytic domain-containing protein [Gammaproteobacteria bacterium]
MNCLVLDGKKVASKSEDFIKSEVSELKKRGITPCLATILVGEDPASATYVKMKQNTCERVGMLSKAITLPSDTTTQQLVQTIYKLNNDKNVHGILLQHPVPKQINERAAFDSIDINKDVDGVTSLGFGLMSMGASAFGSCTPQGIMRLLSEYQIDVCGMNALVVGRSPILGKPMAQMLLNQNATVTIAHSKTKNLISLVKSADLVVGAVGVPKLIKLDWIKKGAVIVDAGYHPSKKCGDVELEGIESVASAYTPVPGGVGPMTINTLILQTLQSAQTR